MKKKYNEAFKRSVLCVFIVAVFGLIAYKKSHLNTSIENKIKEMSINIPLDSMEILTTDLNDYNYAKSQNTADYLYYIIYDSINCTPCFLRKLKIWHSIIKRTNDITGKVEFRFIIRPNDIDSFRKIYSSEKIDLKLYMDTCGIIERHYPLLKLHSVFKAFVLNKENHIELIGNAAKNYEIEQNFYLFLNKIH